MGINKAETRTIVSAHTLYLKNERRNIDCLFFIQLVQQGKKFKVLSAQGRRGKKPKLGRPEIPHGGHENDDTTEAGAMAYYAERIEKKINNGFVKLEVPHLPENLFTAGETYEFLSKFQKEWEALAEKRKLDKAGALFLDTQKVENDGLSVLWETFFK